MVRSLAKRLVTQRVSLGSRDTGSDLLCAKMAAIKLLALHPASDNGSSAGQYACIDDADIVKGILSNDIAPSTPLMEAGLDSLGAVELRTAASAAFSLPLPATAAFDHPTISALADYILSKAPAQQQQVQHKRSVLSLDQECIIMFPTERLLYLL